MDCIIFMNVIRMIISHRDPFSLLVYI